MRSRPTSSRTPSFCRTRNVQGRDLVPFSPSSHFSRLGSSRSHLLSSWVLSLSYCFDLCHVYDYGGHACDHDHDAGVSYLLPDAPRNTRCVSSSSLRTHRSSTDRLPSYSYTTASCRPCVNLFALAPSQRISPIYRWTSPPFASLAVFFWTTWNYSSWSAHHPMLWGI